MKRAAFPSIIILVAFAGLAATRPAAPLNFGILRYASPNGSASNDGASANSPWPLSYALAQGGPSTVISLVPGTYPSIHITRAGTKIISQIKWGAKVAGSAGLHGVWTDSNVGNVTIDGIEVAGSAMDGINLKGSNSVVRNCWIHNSAGNGVSARVLTSTLLERNLLEENGLGSAGGNAIALSGTNCIIRGNVIRYNRNWGCQVYEAPPAGSAECDLYDNVLYGNGSALTVWSGSGRTNNVFSNTILSTKDCLVAHYGTLRLTNNILMRGGSSSVLSVADGAIILTDYNLVNAASTQPAPMILYGPTQASSIAATACIGWHPEARPEALPAPRQSRHLTFLETANLQ